MYLRLADTLRAASGSDSEDDEPRGEDRDDDCEIPSDLENTDTDEYFDESIDENVDSEEDEEAENDHMSDCEGAGLCLPTGYWLRLSEALFQLSMMFWTHQDPAGNMSSSAIIHYTAVMGIQRRTLAFNPAHNSTSELAGLIWIGWLLFLEYALPVYSYATLAYEWPCRDHYPSQPDRPDAIRKMYLIRGCYTPFGEIIELKAFAKSIVKREDGQSFTIGHDKKLKLSEFCATHLKAVELVQERVDEMMLGLKLVDTLKSSSFRGKPFVKGTDWQIDTCIAYPDAGIDLRLPGRGTEMMIIMSYNKARASNNYAFYIVRYLPKGLSRSLLNYLAIIRPVLGYIARQLKVPYWSESEFFFLDPHGKNRRHLTSTQASNVIRHLNRDLATPWTLSSYRQAALAIAKRCLSTLVEKSNFYDPTEATNPLRMFAVGAGHHPRMLLTSYAIDKALPSRLQPKLLEMYHQLSKIWHDWIQQYDQRNISPAGSVTYGQNRDMLRADFGVLEWQRKRIKKGDSVTSEDTDNLSDGFIYNAQHRILMFVSCGSMIQPGAKSFYGHGNSMHRITGSACKALMERFQTYDLCPFDELRIPTGIVPQIPGLTVFKGFRNKIRDHLTIHDLDIAPILAE
ncbi:hypothetical protein DER44DRAFT_815616 [Fusarium oxysporum]|nr:hypothetical protein DER44DRAFT_815616 [Fusarium oxysporum]